MNIEAIRNQILIEEREMQHLNNEISSLENERSNMTEEEYNRNLNNINTYLAQAQERLNQNRQIARAYDSVLTNIRALNQLATLTPRDRQQEDEIAEEKEAREEEIKRMNTFLSEDLQEEIRKTIEEENQTSIIQEEQIKTSSQSQAQDSSLETVSILDPNFNAAGMTYEDFRKKYREERNLYQNNEEMLGRLNNIYSMVRNRRRNEKNNPNYLKDQNGEVMYYPGTSIPQPRLQNWDEPTEDYNAFLYNVFGKQLEENGYFNHDSNNLLRLENKYNIDKQDEVKRLENKYNVDKQDEVKRLENKYPKTNTNSNPTSTTLKNRGYRDVIDELYLAMEEAGFETLGKKDASRVAASNIKVAKNFVNQVKNQPSLFYKITTAAYELPKGIASLIRKGWSKFRTSNEQKERVKFLQEKIQSLPSEDMEILYREYRGNEITNRLDQDSMNFLLNGAIAKYARDMAREYANKNELITRKAYLTKATIDMFQEKMGADKTSKKQKASYQGVIDYLTQDSGKMVGEFLENNNKQEEYLHGNSGIRNQQEDFRSSATKASNKGWRFAKKQDTDFELYHREREAFNAIKEGIIKAENGDKQGNIDALNALIDYNALEHSETSTKKGIFRGLYSTGKREAKEIVEENNYETDKSLLGLRNILLTFAAGTAIVSEYMHQLELQTILEKQKDAFDTVGQAGQTINSNKSTWAEGIKDTTYENIQAMQDIGERHAFTAQMNQNGRMTGDIYYDLDTKYHDMTKNSFDHAYNSFLDIASEHSAGTITDTQMLQQLADVAKDSYNNLLETYRNCVPTLEEYGLSKYATEELIGIISETAQKSPEAVVNMYQSLVDVSSIGDELVTLSAEQTQALQSLPSNMLSTVMTTAAMYGLVCQTGKSMANSNYNEEAKQANESLADMIADYEQMNTKDFLHEYNQGEEIFNQYNGNTQQTRGK